MTDRTQETTITNLALARMVDFVREEEDFSGEIYKGESPNGKPITTYYFISKEMPSLDLIRRIGDFEGELRNSIKFTGNIFAYTKEKLPKGVEKKIWPLVD